MPRLLRHILCALLTVCLTAGAAAALVTGSAELNWADYQIDIEDGEDVEASHFYQRYSLMYQSHNKINSGKAGYWDMGVGYEWASLSSSVNDFDDKTSSGKLLYNGDFLFAPGGLPFRVQAYAHDMAPQTPRDENRTIGLLSPEIHTDLMSGKRFVAGITLLAGIKNGSYLGQYREILSTLPKLLIDYREVTVEDSEGLYREHTRVRDLAFVSLNKKDNWFHYRVTEYDDYNSPTSSFEERAYVIGTIDHTLRRQWINLTNWIKLSVDGSLTQLQVSPLTNRPSEDTYQLNLFTLARRADWNLANYTTMVRRTDSDGLLEKELEIPVFASGQYDPRNSWRTTLVHSSRERTYSGRTDRKEDLLYAAYRLESQRPSGTLLSATADVDVQHDVINGDGQAVRLDVELSTDPRRDSTTAWRTEYSVAMFSSNESSKNFIEQALTLSIDENRAPLRYGGNLQLGLGFGTFEPSTTHRILPFLALGFRDAAYSESALDGTTWRAQVDGYLEFRTAGRWQHRLEGYYDHIQAEESESRLRLSHVLTYSGREITTTSLTRFESGDDLTYMSTDSEEFNLASYTGVLDWYATNETTVQYAPTQAWQTKGIVSAAWGSGEVGEATFVRAEQSSVYSLYGSGGLRRKWFDLEQKFAYERVWTNAGSSLPGDLWYAEFGLAAIIHPTHFLSLQGRTEFRRYGVYDSNEFECGIEADFNFPMLAANVSYEYAQSDGSSGLTQAFKEQRWEVGVRKTF